MATKETLEERIQRKLDYYDLKREWLTDEEYEMLKREEASTDVTILDGFSAIAGEIHFRGIAMEARKAR